MIAGAQTTPDAQPTVEVDPVQCWWRTNTASVRVGEGFNIVLTCAALETDAATAVIDRSRLGAAAVQFPPFEVTGGTQSADHVTAGRRYMQYRYDLRLIAEDFFGSDIVIPALTVAYRIESRVQADASLQGREQTYEMPPLTMRINALVANGTTHIREAEAPSLEAIAARASRARLLRLMAIILVGAAALTLLAALVRAFRQRRKADTTVTKHLLTHGAVLAGARRELRALQTETRGGWEPGLVARALAATRVVATYLAGRPAAQREVDHASGGELALGRGIVARRRVAVSGATTAHSLRPFAGATGLDEALRTFTAARYGRSDTYDEATLTEALGTAGRVAGRVAARHTWAAEAVKSSAATVRGWAPRAWAR